MKNCIMARKENGIYEIVASASEEKWETVEKIADNVTYVEPLIGWGGYSTAYIVSVDGQEYTYVVYE